MKFEADGIKWLLHELDSPRFSGPDGEANVADFVADQLATMGLDVERREVTGSRFPQRVAPWIGWLGYGLLVTAVYGLFATGNVPLSFLALLVSGCCTLWLDSVVRNRLHPGRERDPIEMAPVVVASRPDRPPTAMRVIFQAAISGVRADPFHFWIKGSARRLVVHGVLFLFPLCWSFLFFLLQPRFILHPSRPFLLMVSGFLWRCAYPSFLGAVWIGIVVLLVLEFRDRRARATRNPPDRRGLALLLELARTWPRTGSRPLEPVFVVAGGQELNYAGSREVVRLLKREWATAPFLLILFFEPGAGEELWLSTSVYSGEGLGELTEAAARSLWIPYRRDRDYVLESLWPFVRDHPAVAVMGSDPRAFGDDSTDPEAVVRAAQLATEVALRWARNPDISLHPLNGRWELVLPPS